MTVRPFAAAKGCPQCKGEGFYYRLPPKVNPFAASIEVTAANMKRITCHCTTRWPAQPTTVPHDPEGTDR